jgi:peptide/nickel transport system permease protein
VTIITFTLTYVLPGNPAVVKAGPLVSPDVVAELEKSMGLDQPPWVQYWRYMSGVLRGDLGESASTGRPVLEDFKQRLPATLELTLASLFIALVLGIPLGVQSAVHRDTAIDHIGRVVGVAGVAMPTFWTGLLSPSFLLPAGPRRRRSDELAPASRHRMPSPVFMSSTAC